MRRAALTAALLAASLGGGCNSGEELTLFEAILKPENEIPARTSAAAGVARFTFDGTTVNYRVVASKLDNYTQGHIHSGSASVNGPVRVFLYGLAAPASITEGTLVQGSFTAANVTGITFDALIQEMRSGNAYVNFHTTLYPGGEIRGQLQLVN